MSNKVFNYAVFSAAAYFVLLIAANGQEMVFPNAPPAVPEVDPFAQMLSLFRDYKSMSPIALGVGFVTLVTQVIKSYFKQFKFKRLLVTALSLAYGVLISIQQGLHVFDALILIMITGGGAVALYEAIKGTLNTVKK